MKIHIKYIIGIFIFFVTLLTPVKIVCADIVSEQQSNNVSWKIDDDGQLLINGSGDWERDSYGHAPWFAYNSSIKSAKVNLVGTTDCSYMFVGQGSLKNVDLTEFDTSSVLNMENMFLSCSNLIKIVSNDLDTSKVSSMRSMFDGCRNLCDFDFSVIDFNNCQSTYLMFAGCDSVQTFDFHEKNMEKVKNMSGMFLGCKELVAVNLSRVNAKDAQDMMAMFQDCPKLSSVNLNDFYAISIVNMERMFMNCYKLENLDMSSIESDKITRVVKMFYCCNLKELDMRGMDFEYVKKNYPGGATDYDYMISANSSYLDIFRTPKNVNAQIDLPIVNGKQKMYYGSENTTIIPRGLPESVTLYKNAPQYEFKGFYKNTKEEDLIKECSVPENTGKDEALAKLPSTGYIGLQKNGVFELKPIIISWRCVNYDGTVKQSYDAIGDVYIDDPSINIGMVNFGEYPNYIKGKIEVTKKLLFNGYFLDDKGAYLNTRVEVEKGTSSSAALKKMPSKGYVLLDDNYYPMSITWNCPDYDGNKEGKYHVQGTVHFSNGITEDAIDFKGCDPKIDAYLVIRGEREKAIKQRLDLIKNGEIEITVQDTGAKIPVGKVNTYFTDNGLKCSDHLSVVDNHCGTDINSHNCNCILYKNSVQCLAFAKFVRDNIYNIPAGGELKLVRNASMDAQNVSELFLKAQIGDWLEFGEMDHFAIVTDVDSESVTIYHCNDGYECQIKEEKYTFDGFVQHFRESFLYTVGLYTAGDGWTIKGAEIPGSGGSEDTGKNVKDNKEKSDLDSASNNENPTYESSNKLVANTLISVGKNSKENVSLGGIKSEPRDTINQQIFADAMAPKNYKVQEVFETYNIYPPIDAKNSWKKASRTLVWADSRIKENDVIYVVWYCQEIKQNKLIPAKVIADGVIEFTVPRVGDCSIVTIVKMKSIK